MWTLFIHSAKQWPTCSRCEDRCLQRTETCNGLLLKSWKNLEEISSSVITKWKCNFPSCPLRKQLKNKCGTQRWRRKTETFPGHVEKSVGTKPKRISTSEPEQKVMALKRKQRFFFRHSEQENNHENFCPICKRKGSTQLVNILHNEYSIMSLKKIKSHWGKNDTGCLWRS